MTVVVVSDKNARVQDMEGAYGGVNIGAGPGGNDDTEQIYEGIQSWGRQVGNVAARGLSVGITAVNMTEPSASVFMVKTIVTNKVAINSAAYNLFIGDGAAGTDAYRYVIADDGTLEAVVGSAPGDRIYPIKGGWLVLAVNPNITAWRDEVVGTPPTLTAIDEFGVSSGMSSTARDLNLFIDAIDLSGGLFLVSGDGADPDGTFQDFIDYDENEGGSAGSGDRIGHIVTLEGIVYVLGRLVIGRDSGSVVITTAFDDSLQTLVFPGGRVDVGWNALEIDLSDKDTVVNWENINIIGRGRDNLKRWFDTENEVDATLDEIHNVDHGYNTGDAVLYSLEGGTVLSGLTDATEYFVRAVSADSMSLHDTRLNAYNDASVLALTPAGAGEQHSLRRQPDTRPNLDVIGATGSFTASGCVFQTMRRLSLTGSSVLDGCTLVNCTKLEPSGGLVTDCIVVAPLLAEGESFIVTDDLSLVAGGTFTAGDNGHALEIIVTGSFQFSGNTFNDYNITEQTFDTTDDIDDGADEIDLTGHPYTTGDAIYYIAGGLQSIGLTDSTRYYIRSVTANAISLHVTKEDAESNSNKIALTAGGAETHALYSANAALFNNSGGSVTASVVGGGTAPTVRNSSGSATLVIAQTEVTLTGLTSGSEVRVYDSDTEAEIDGVEDVGPTGQFVFTDSAGNNVFIVIHDITQIYILIEDFTIPVTAVSLPISQEFDRNYENPA
jgi:hypothetical protein